jgi:hypothetical protein
MYSGNPLLLFHSEIFVVPLLLVKNIEHKYRVDLVVDTMTTIINHVMYKD